MMELFSNLLGQNSIAKGGCKTASNNKRDFYEVENENSIYMANQYKEVSAVNMQIEIR